MIGKNACIMHIPSRGVLHKGMAMFETGGMVGGSGAGSGADPCGNGDLYSL